MPTTKTTKKSTARKPAKKSTAARKSAAGFTADERAAMKEHARELKAQRAGADGEKEVLEAIAKMPPSDRALGEKIHEIVRDSAPDLSPKTWYGMPAYANKDGKVVLFFRGAHKFKERYAMLGFNDSAKLDDGAMWPIAYALPKLTASDEKKLATLVKKAVKE
jgi:uncharacterized protein YdhG (YjbR/CyaY superfamily)